MKTKKQFNLYSFYDLTGMSKHLERMAKKGWFIKKTGTFLWTYQAGEPKNLHYALCCSGESEAFDPQPGEQALNFREHAKAAGWELAASNPRLEVYSSEMENPGELSASPYDRIEGIRQAAKPSFFFYAIMMVLAVLSIILQVFKFKIMPVDALASSFSLVAPVILTLVGLFFLTDMIFYFVWKNKADIGATENKYVQAPVHMNRAFVYLLIVSAILLALGAVTSGRSPLMRTFLIYLVGIVSLLLVVGAVRDVIKKKDSKNRFWIVAVNVVLAVILVGGVILATNQMNMAEAGYNGEMPLTAKDLGLVTDADPVHDYSRSKSSYFLCYTEASQVKTFENGEYEPLISYELVEGREVRVDGMILDYYLKRMSATVQTLEDGKTTVSNHYEPMDASLWGADQAWQMYCGEEADSVYLLIYGNRLLELGAKDLLTEEQMTAVGTVFAK